MPGAGPGGVGVGPGGLGVGPGGVGVGPGGVGVGPGGAGVGPGGVGPEGAGGFFFPKNFSPIFSQKDLGFFDAFLVFSSKNLSCFFLNSSSDKTLYACEIF